jgi:hypothetical protein
MINTAGGCYWSSVDVDWSNLRYIRIEDDNRYVTTINKLQIGDLRIIGEVPVVPNGYIGHVHATVSSSLVSYVFDSEALTDNRGMSDYMSPGDPNATHMTGRMAWCSASGAAQGATIDFNLGGSYTLGQMLIWNANWTTANTRGIKDMLIEYSADGGVTYTAMGDHNGALPGNYSMEMAPVDETGNTLGDSHYQFAALLGGTTADHVRVTALNNWGDASYCALSEVRFYNTQVVAEMMVPEPSVLVGLIALALVGLVRRRG